MDALCIAVLPSTSSSIAHALSDKRKDRIPALTDVPRNAGLLLLPSELEGVPQISRASRCTCWIRIHIDSILAQNGFFRCVSHGWVWIQQLIHIVFVTGNENKLREVKAILAAGGTGVEVTSQAVDGESRCIFGLTRCEPGGLSRDEEANGAGMARTSADS